MLIYAEKTLYHFCKERKSRNYIRDSCSSVCVSPSAVDVLAGTNYALDKYELSCGCRRKQANSLKRKNIITNMSKA